jgi:hypothetical protein
MEAYSLYKYVGKMRKIVILFLLIFSGFQISAQFDEDKTGAWYIYAFNGKFKNSNFGIKGDIQYRNWNLGGDLEQLLLRGGINYQPEGSSMLITLGYANITTGVMGDENSTSAENRIYQEVILPQNPLKRLNLSHRFRYEQRFVENQDFRTRYRYNLSLNLPLNNTKIEKGSIYIALYNELFINGQRKIAEDTNVELYDRNRSYVGLGYALNDKMKIQAGWMKQTTDNWSKSQLNLSLSQRIF